MRLHLTIKKQKDKGRKMQKYMEQKSKVSYIRDFFFSDADWNIEGTLKYLAKNTQPFLVHLVLAHSSVHQGADMLPPQRRVVYFLDKSWCCAFSMLEMPLILQVMASKLQLHPGKSQCWEGWERNCWIYWFWYLFYNQKLMWTPFRFKSHI